MKLKYYLRGLGIGIIATTLILMIAFSQYKNDISDAEVIKRAEALGMVMKEDTLFNRNTEAQADTSGETEQVTETIMATESEVTEVPTETSVETETQSESEQPTETEQPTESETETEATTETTVSTENAGTATGETYHLIIASGAVPRTICAELEENGVITDATSLRQYLSDVGYAKSIVTGEYEIPYGASNEEIYQILKAGPKR